MGAIPVGFSQGQDNVLGKDTAFWQAACAGMGSGSRSRPGSLSAAADSSADSSLVRLALYTLSRRLHVRKAPLYLPTSLGKPTCPGKVLLHRLFRLVCALQARLADANRNLAARVLHLTAQLAAAVGPAFDRAGRPLLVAGTALLNDNKKQVWPALDYSSFVSSLHAGACS